jgi:hypothetical protein
MLAETQASSAPIWTGVRARQVVVIGNMLNAQLRGFAACDADVTVCGPLLPAFHKRHDIFGIRRDLPNGHCNAQSRRVELDIVCV